MIKRILAFFGFTTTVESITAGLQKTLSKLEDHIEAKHAEEAQHLATADKFAAKAEAAAAERDRAKTVGKNLNALLAN